MFEKKKAMVGANVLNRFISNEKWDMAIEYTRSYPREARSWSTRPGFFEGVKESTVLPIHAASALHPPVEIINVLCAAYPESLKLTESAYRRNALHIACRSQASAEVVKALMEYGPEAAVTDDSLGRLPIHYALSNAATDEVILIMLKKYPGTARCTDTRGWLPIHVACSVGSSLEVVKALLDAYPESVTLRTSKGNTPLACTNLLRSAKRNEEVVQMLEVASAKQNSNYRPPPKRPTSIPTLV
mmetsp:Transcript_17698/g.27093  ORF Transcript_17698/g.27093 Transcript_17698/m.27093 type:complete len:244 (+) Transcript_17698:211-942(+)